jgi:hypothetical protein
MVTGSLCPAPSDHSDGAGAPEPEIDITPEMVAAGVSALCDVRSDFESDSEIVMRIYRVMQLAVATTSCVHP